MPRKTSIRSKLRLKLRRRRFNEAAARCHGKLAGPGRGRRERTASMRPRPDATENALGGRLVFGPAPTLQ